MTRQEIMVRNRQPTRLSAPAIAKDRFTSKPFALLHTLEGHSKNVYSAQFSYVYSAQFSPDGTKIVTASWDKTAKIWNANTGELLHTLNHSNSVRSAQFSPDGTKIVTASLDNTAKIWGPSTAYKFFTNPVLPLKYQTLLVTLELLSKQNNGGPIKKSYIVADPDKTDTSRLFTEIPEDVLSELKNVYKIEDDVLVS